MERQEKKSKKDYLTPTAEIVFFDADDIITSSTKRDPDEGEWDTENVKGR